VSFLTLPADIGGLSHGVHRWAWGWVRPRPCGIVSGAPLRSLSCVATAQTYSYLWLCQRTIRLTTMIEGVQAARRPEDAAALKEIDQYLARLRNELGMPPAPAMAATAPEPTPRPACGLRYVSATGYLDLWRLVYRSEELLLQLDDSIAVDGAIYDALRLDDSTLPSRDSLRAKLKFCDQRPQPSRCRVSRDADSAASHPGRARAGGQRRRK